MFFFYLLFDDLDMGFLEIQILFWDWRNGKQVACLEESHTEDVTQVSFFLSLTW